jgi:anti-anti-sigma factor
MHSVLVRSSPLIVQPRGSVNSKNVVTFRYQISAALLSEQHDQLLLDMAQVESIDSAGLMALVSALSLARQLNKRLSLCSLSHSVRFILELAQLDGVFEILD